MLKMSRKPSKKLAKLVLATLLFTGWAQLAISPAVVEAGSFASAPTITGTVVKDGGKIIFTEASCTWSGGSPNQGAGNVALGGPTALSQTPAEGYNVTITEATGWYRFDGAYLNSHSSTIKDNTLTVNGGSFSYGVAGGTIFASGNNLVTKNTVIVNDGTMYEACGGLIQAYGGIPGDAIDNTVYINGGQVEYVCGGSADKGDANDNKVFIKGGVTSDGVVGGKVRYEYGGDANGNTVTISGGTIGKASGGTNIVGGYTIGGGGSAQNGAANDNTVTISGGTITSSSVVGGNSYKGNANGNTVTISGGTIGKAGSVTRIWGGFASNDSASNVSANDNTVTISGDVQFLGSVSIYGAEAGKTSGTANNNTVNILAKITAAQLAGGNTPGTSSGNTLNIAAKGVTTGAVYGFQNMNFYLPSDVANNDTMLTVNDSSGTNVKDVTFGAAALSGVKLVKGDTVNLITNPNGLTTDDNLKTTTEFTVPEGLVKDDAYELSISKKDANTIIATVDNVTEKKAPEEAVGDILKSPVETRAGVVTMINAGADLLVSQGMANAAEAAAAERSGDNAAAAPKAGGFAPFAAVSFGKLRAQSGSHVDNKGIGMNLGFAREIENKNGKLLVGPVIEYGHGSYDSYQDSGIKADGKSSYWGIGVIAKQTNDNGFYYEGSLRAGRTKSDYNSDLRPGLHVSYDSSATYWAAHLGVGKLVDIGHDNTLDYYGKYFYSHTGSDSTYLNGANETANFDAVNSHRIRLGARLTHALNEKNKIYGGLAWQYEFKGDARATYSVSGEAPSPSVKGSSGMIELGWQVKPGKSPMTIDLGVTGWVGKQRGITANLQANWTF